MMKKLARIVLFLALIVWIGGYSAFLSNIHTVAPQNPTIKTDAIVVLTGGNFRITTGLSLFVHDLSPKLFITGVHSDVTEEEIRSMWKGNPALPECCITLGHEATTTFENALETENWVKDNSIRSIRLITSTYHMPRASLEFRNILKDTEIILHPVEKTDYTKKDLVFWKITFDEYNKVIYRKIIFQLEKQGLLK